MTATVARATSIQEIPLAQLDVHRLNPRTDAGDIGELTDSIRSAGVLEPLIAVRDNGGFAVVAGSRRLAAARKAGLATVPVIVREMSESEIGAAALIENLQRRDLAPLEEARGYRQWLDLTKKSQAELAKSIGKAPSTIANALRLLEAPQPVRHALENGTITAAHARVALELKDPALVMKLPLKVGVTVDQLKATVDTVNLAAELNGAPAIAAAKAFLEKARADHPKATITWEKQKDFAYAREVLDLVKALGKPPADVVGQIDGGMYGNGPTAATHNKACQCDAYLIEASRDYPKPGLKLALKRVCIDRAGWRKSRPKPKKTKATTAAKKAKPLTPEQEEKLEAKRQAEEAALEEKLRKERRQNAANALEAPKPEKPEHRPIFTAVAKGQIPAAVARLIVYQERISDEYSGDLDDDEATIAWALLENMPAKKVSGLAASILARRFADSLRWLHPKAMGASTCRTVARSLGMKIAEPEAPKPKKKAKR